MLNIKRDLNDIVNTESKQYAQYTVTSRAIPHLIDGLKPSQRFILASCIQDAFTNYVKVASLAGNVSKFGYQHGETSAGDSGILMAADWSNNINLLEGRGNFGSRIIKDAAAQRYVYARVHDNFSSLFKDLDIKYNHPDAEIKVPQFYVPTLPIILLNGIQGIATGFAVNILPHDIEWVKNATREYVSTGNITTKPVIKFPSFKGTVEDNGDGSYTQSGCFERLSDYQINITEIPTALDLNKYLKILDALQDANKIVSWEDGTDKSGFNFKVKLKRGNNNANDVKWVMKLFKLESRMHQNLNVVCPSDQLDDINGMYILKQYDTVIDIIKDFVDWVVGVHLPKRISNKISNLTFDINYNNARMQFINDVNQGNINLGDMTKTKLKEYLKGICNDNDICDKLSKMNAYRFTKDEIAISKRSLKKLNEELKYWELTTPSIQLISDLDNIKL